MHPHQRILTLPVLLALAASTVGLGGYSQQPKEGAPLRRQGTVVLKPWEAYDTRDGAVANMRAATFGSEKLEIGYANNQIIAGPYKKDGQIASGASAVFDHGIWPSIENLIAHHRKQGDMAWSSGNRSNRVSKGHCYTFAFPGRPPMYLRVLEVQTDGSIKIAWLDTDTRMSLKRALKDSRLSGAISQQRLQGTWKGETSGQEMLAHFKADSVSFEGGLGSFLGPGPYKYTVTADAIDILWNTPQANRTLRFQVFRVGDKLFMFEGRKEYTDIQLVRVAIPSTVQITGSTKEVAEGGVMISSNAVGAISSQFLQGRWEPRPMQSNPASLTFEGTTLVWGQNGREPKRYPFQLAGNELQISSQGSYRTICTLKIMGDNTMEWLEGGASMTLIRIK